MTIEFKGSLCDEKTDTQILEVQVTGELKRQEYRALVAAVERMIERHRKVRVLFNMVGFEVETADALWEHLKFDVKGIYEIERLAIVGEKNWEHGSATFCGPSTLTTAKLRYFERTQLEDARRWIKPGRYHAQTYQHSRISP
jgi:hypothetical protein